MEKDAREEQIAVQLGVDRAERGGAAHHLRDMLHQSAAAGVVVLARGGGAPETAA